MDTKRFAAFLNEAYFKYAHKKGRLTSAADFSVWLGVPPTSLSSWMTGAHTPKGENVHRLAAKLGPEVYDLLNMPRLMPSDPLFRKIAEVWFDLDDATRDRILEIASSHKDNGGNFSKET